MTEQEIPTFYHGTRRPFDKGGLLVPRSMHGGAGTSAPLKWGEVDRDDASRYVFVTTDNILAWAYAWHAPGRGRPRVLTVRPMGPVWQDPEHTDDMEAYRCEAATVVAIDLVPAIDEYEAAAGWVEADLEYYE